MQIKLKQLATMIACILLGTGLQAQRNLTLAQSLDLALQNSPDIKRSSLNLENRRESLNANLASLKSNLSLDVTPFGFRRNRSFDERFATWYTNEEFSYSGTFSVSQPIMMTDGTLSLHNALRWQETETIFQGQTNTNDTYSNNLYLSYSQPLFTYNRRKLALKELELALENAQLSHSIQQLNIERSVTTSFYDVYREQERLTIAQEEFENQQKNYEIIKNKTESGMIPRAELFQAELNLSNSESSWENQKVMVENTKDNFKQLLGINLYEEVSVSADIVSQQVEVDLTYAIDQGLKYRQELRQQEINMVYAQNEMIRTKASNEFSGNLDLTVGIFGDNVKLPNVYETPTNNPSVQLTFSIPLYDFGAKKSRMKATEANIATEVLNMTDQKNNIIIGIRQVYRSLQNLENQIKIGEQSVRNAQQTYELNQERYKNGDITGLDLNQYQNQLSQAKIDLMTSKINYKLELLNLKIQSLWDFEANISVLDTNQTEK